MKKFFISLFVLIIFCNISFAQSVYGDVNGDGEVTANDVTEIYNILLGNAAKIFQYNVNGVEFKMVKIDGGTYTMGAAEDDSDAYAKEKPIHQVVLDSYTIGLTEVTQELWLAVMGNNPSYFSVNNDYTDNLQKPVENVSWLDCQEFIAKLNEITGETFRLPTEAEWEIAARGGNKSKGYKYSGSNNIGDVCWYGSNIPSQSEGSDGYGTQPVARKLPNELGIFDMSGNVNEWCSDWYDSNYYTVSEIYNPTGPVTGNSKVNRGGDWSDIPRNCRVTYRIGNIGASNLIGLRLAMSI